MDNKSKMQKCKNNQTVCHTIRESMTEAKALSMEWENTPVNDVTNKELAFKITKNSHYSVTKTLINQFKNG